MGWLRCLSEERQLYLAKALTSPYSRRMAALAVIVVACLVTALVTGLVWASVDRPLNSQMESFPVEATRCTITAVDKARLCNTVGGERFAAVYNLTVIYARETAMNRVGYSNVEPGRCGGQDEYFVDQPVPCWLRQSNVTAGGVIVRVSKPSYKLLFVAIGTGFAALVSLALLVWVCRLRQALDDAEEGKQRVTLERLVAMADEEQRREGGNYLLRPGQHGA